MTTIHFNPRPALPTPNPFGALAGLPEGYELICTSDSCFCRSVFEEIVSTYEKLGDTFLYINSILFVSPEVAKKVKENVELAPMRY